MKKKVFYFKINENVPWRGDHLMQTCWGTLTCTMMVHLRSLIHSVYSSLTGTPPSREGGLRARKGPETLKKEIYIMSADANMIRYPRAQRSTFCSPLPKAWTKRGVIVELPTAVLFPRGVIVERWLKSLLPLNLGQCQLYVHYGYPIMSL